MTYDTASRYLQHQMWFVIDIVKLSEDLTNAEKEPQEKIQGDIDATSIYIACVCGSSECIKSALEFNDANEIATSTGTIDAKRLYPMSGATAGAYDLNSIGAEPTVMSDQYTSNTQSLNSGSAFNLSMAVGTTKLLLPRYTVLLTPSKRRR